MRKFKLWRNALLLMLVACLALGWAAVVGQSDPLNKSDTFMLGENGKLYWYEFNSDEGKIDGKLHTFEIVTLPGKVPFLDEKEYPLIGKATESGYEFKVDFDGGEFKVYNAWFSGANLSVQAQGEDAVKLFQPMSYEELAEYTAEEREKDRIRTFFTDLKSAYGFVASSENGDYLLFLKIDEALLQGEISGSLLVVDVAGEESKYEVNGITDGQMLRLYTTVDGKKIKLTGEFVDSATAFDMAFWKGDNEKVHFTAVKEEEFHQIYENFTK